MKFTLNWLNQFVSTEGFTPDRIANQLTMLGLEVDSCAELFTELEPILTARILQVERHPDADKLTVCSVDTGSETIQVVCGAPNVHAGLVTALALPGTRLPGGIKIKKSKVRGCVSEGMLCSAHELGLQNDHSGILEMDETLSPGLPLPQALGLRDTVIEVELTPNRADCASVHGIAREVSSFTGTALQPLVHTIAPLNSVPTDYRVTIQDENLCPRYTARKLTKVCIGPSPAWMQQRLSAVGMRPINNIVDITNYVMLESGQPLHAFDFDTLKNSEIIVRRPQPHETALTTLDGTVRGLDDDMLLICDGQGPIAIAGVMGGMETEITEKTTTILLESACFDPVSIRKTARKLGIHSEASYRFERGVDPNLTDSALQRAVNLMVAHAEAEAVADGIDVYPGKKEPLVIQLRVARLCSLLGIELNAQEIANHLSRIEFSTSVVDAQHLQVHVPSFRMDIEREIDLIEEVARLVGYNTIPTTQPSIRMDYPVRDVLRTLREKIAHIMTAQGFFEVIHYSFTSEKNLNHCLLAPTDPRRQVTRLLNPISEEQHIMRPILLPGMLETIRHNLNFQQNDIRLFETGKVFLQKENNQSPEERQQLCAALSGHRYPQAQTLHFSGLEADFFDIKGAASNLLSILRLDDETQICFTPVEADQAEPYCIPNASLAIKTGDDTIGMLGMIRPQVLQAFDIKQAVYFLVMDLQQLAALESSKAQFSPLPRYPAVKRDISLVVPEGVPAGNLVRVLYGYRQKHLESAEIFDIYQGVSVPKGYKSVALSISYRSASGTLEDQSVEKIHEKIVRALMSDFNARYREGTEQ